MARPGIVSTIKQSFKDFFADDVMTAGASLAFYSALSLAPLVLLFVSVAGLLNRDAQHTIVDQFTALVGAKGGKAIEAIVESANDKESAGVAGSIISGVILLFSASAIFAQFQAALNRIFHVQPRPGAGIWGWLRKRIFSIGMLFALGFLMVISLIVSAGLQMMSFTGQGILWEALNLGVSIAVFSLFFAAVYKYLPDVVMSWRDVWIGAVSTGILFSLGKSAIGLYLGNSAVGSAYGAAGSLIVFLLWVYYSSMIILFGAELTRELARTFGKGIKPNEYAVPLDEHGFAAPA